jgi:DNA ligase-1
VEVEDRPADGDAVLIYAQAGHGRRAGVYTDYTFAVWSRPPRDAAEAQAVVDAIAARVPGPTRRAAAGALRQGLFGPERCRVRAGGPVIRAHTLEKFGPVRSVRPTLVFELGFEGINAARATRAASRCASRACCASATTSRCTRPTRLPDAGC